jgi:hypothetical protein
VKWTVETYFLVKVYQFPEQQTPEDLVMSMKKVCVEIENAEQQSLWNGKAKGECFQRFTLLTPSFAILWTRRARVFEKTPKKVVKLSTMLTMYFMCVSWLSFLATRYRLAHFLRAHSSYHKTQTKILGSRLFNMWLTRNEKHTRIYKYIQNIRT